MPDLEVSKLPALAGTALQATDPLPLADLSASETKRITAKDLIQHGIALIDDKSIPSTKFDFAVPAGSIGTTELKADAVTADKLADNSTVSVGAAWATAGDFIGQFGYEIATGKLRIWDGNTWQAPKAAGSINLIQPDTTGVIRATVSQSGDEATLNIEPADTAAARQFLAGPTGAAGAVTARQIVGSDLPTAEPTSKGAVEVSGFGLRMNGSRLQIDNAVTPSGVTYGVVTYNAQGLVTDGRALLGTDLPLATGASPGAVVLGSQFGAGPGGALIHANSIQAGTGTKITFDSSGHITSTQPLAAADIPDLDASKLTTGSIATALLGDGSVTAEKLADYAISYIQEASPPVTGQRAGRVWLQESSGQLRMWNGNSWFPIGFGRLSAENLRYCGIFDASTGNITGVTQFGSSEGFKIGDPVPGATDPKSGVYFVCATAGATVTVTPGVTYDQGDWLLCNGAAAGWTRIDTLNGGGGGGVAHLDDLLDVEIAAAVTGQILQLAASGQWKNVDFPEATTTSKGGTQYATSSDVTAGVSTKAVTADLLKTTNDAVGGVQSSVTTLQGQITGLQGKTGDATTTTKGIVQLADSAAIAVGTAGHVVDAAELKMQAATYAKLDAAQVFTKAQRGGVVTLTDAATIAVDLAAGNYFTVTLGGNRQLGAPSNAVAGQSGVIRVVQDGTGSKTLSYDAVWKWPGGTAPTLTTTANAIDLLAYYCESVGRITVRFVGDVK